MIGFGDTLHAFVKGTGIRLDQGTRKVLIDVARDLMLATPVDTGNARSNWFFGSTRNPSIETGKNKNGAPSIKRSLEFAANLKAGGVFFITNNLSYILDLEYGSSKQAPTGMARNVVARWQKIVDGAMAEGSQKSRIADYRGQA